MFKIGIETESCHLAFQNNRLDIFGFIDKAAEYGFDGVMINIIEKKNQTEGLGALGRDDPEHLRRVAAAIREKGLFVELDTRGTGFEHLSHVIDIAEILGADVIRTFVMSGSGYSHGNLVGSFDPANFAKAADEFEKIVPLLEKHRIKLGVENHEIETMDEILSVVDAVDSPWVGVHFDLGNTMMAWEDPLSGARKAAPKAVSTHMKDHIICKNDDEYVVCGVPMGEGNIDIKAAVRILAENSTLGRMVIEMCYPYASAFKRPAGTGGVKEVGEGAFAVKEAPFPPSKVKPLDYYLYEGELLDEMIAKQYAGMKKSGQCLREAVRQIMEETGNR